MSSHRVSRKTSDSDKHLFGDNKKTVNFRLDHKGIVQNGIDLDNGKCFEDDMKGFDSKCNDISNGVNRGYEGNSCMNGNFNSSDINLLDRKTVDVFASTREYDFNKRHVKSHMPEHIDKTFKDVTNESTTESDEKLNDDGFLNDADAILYGYDNENDILQSKDQTYKSKNNRKSNSTVMSLKQFGLDQEIDVRYKPPLRCSKSHQRFSMDGWKKRAVARKHSAKLTKIDKVTENSESANVKENDVNLKKAEENRNTQESFQIYSNDDSNSNLGESREHSSGLKKLDKDDSGEKKGGEEMSETDQNAENMVEAFGDVEDKDDDEETLPHSTKPLYDANNSSTAMILLNNRDNKNSRLWRRHTSQHNRGNLINPARHTHNTSPNTVHARCRSSSFAKHDPVKPRLIFPERPQSEKIGDRLHEGRMSVNPHRHRACTVISNGSLSSLDSSGDTRKDENSSNKNKWLRIYSRPHERREPTGITKTVPNFREMIKSPAWSSTNTASIYNKRQKQCNV